jgi:hypothetical protein
MGAIPHPNPPPQGGRARVGGFVVIRIIRE